MSAYPPGGGRRRHGDAACGSSGATRGVRLRPLGRRSWVRGSGPGSGRSCARTTCRSPRTRWGGLPVMSGLSARPRGPAPAAGAGSGWTGMASDVPRDAQGRRLSRNAGLVGLKFCESAKCPENNPQPYSSFHRDARQTTGLHRYCKTCRKRQASQYKQHKREYDAARYQENKDEVIARVEEYFFRNRETRLAQIAAWAAGNPDRARAAQRRHRQTPRGKAQGREDAQKRRARIAAVPIEEFTHEEIFDRDGWVCQLCQAAVDPVLEWPDRMSASLDHVIPLCRGGSHTRDNVQLAHLVCNIRKACNVEEVMPCGSAENIVEQVEKSRGMPSESCATGSRA
jgi:HNH endonuclease